MLNRLSNFVQYNRDWLKYLTYRFLPTHDDAPVAFRLRNGQVVRMSRDGRFTLNEIYLDHVYEVPGVNSAQCSNVLDLGANVGVFALYVASIAPQATVYCFEPASRNFSLLTRNIKENRVSARPYQLAVSANPGIGHLELWNISTAYSLGNSGEHSERVDCVDLAQVFQLTGVDRFDFVKMDVEGAELEIFERCSDQQLQSISALAVEWHHSVEQLEAVVARLRLLGFEAHLQIWPGHGRFLRARMRDASPPS